MNTENEEDFVFEKLDICSCGDTYNQVKFIFDYLTTLQNNEELSKSGWDKSRQLIIDNAETVYQLLNHFLAAKDLLTYGSSVCYPWFDDTKENIEFLEKIKSIL